MSDKEISTFLFQNSLLEYSARNEFLDSSLYIEKVSKVWGALPPGGWWSSWAGGVFI
jgi:hypothetical protein